MFLMSFFSIILLIVGFIFFLVKLQYGKKFLKDERFNLIQLYSSRFASFILIIGLFLILILFGFGGLTKVLRTNINTYKDLLTVSTIMLIGLYFVTDFICFHILNKRM